MFCFANSVVPRQRPEEDLNVGRRPADPSSSRSAHNAIDPAPAARDAVPADWPRCTGSAPPGRARRCPRRSGRRSPAPSRSARTRPARGSRHSPRPRRSSPRTPGSTSRPTRSTTTPSRTRSTATCRASPDDVFTWFAGYRMQFFAAKGLATPIDDVWKALTPQMPPSIKAASTGLDGHQYLVPNKNYPWAVYYRKSLWKEKGYTAPKTWDQFIALAKKMQTDGLTPIAFTDKDGWPAMGTFDILNMRINGYQFHVDLMAGKESWDSPQVEGRLQAVGGAPPVLLAGRARPHVAGRRDAAREQAGRHVPARRVRRSATSSRPTRATSTSSRSRRSTRSGGRTRSTPRSTATCSRRSRRTWPARRS